MSAYFYRLLITIKRKPIADIVAVVGIFAAIITVASLNRIPVHLVPRNDETVLGIMSILLIICFDYAFVTGFRSGVLGYHPADMTFQFAAPFTRVFNLIVSFPYGLGSLVVFLWLMCVNSPVLTWWIGFTSGDFIAFVIEAFFIMTLTFLLTSFISARFTDQVWVKVVAVVLLFVMHFVLFFVVLRDLISEYGSYAVLREQTMMIILEKVGNSYWADAFPIAGWVGLIYKGILRGVTSYFPVVIALYLMFVILVLFLYHFGKFDFYEEATTNTGRILEIVEASKAGVEAVNTGIARTARVGKEVYKRGWGASAFFHMHLFENLRTSKLFFINKVALIYRAFGLIFLLIADSLVSEELDIAVIVVGVCTMMVLNAIVFGGGKTVLELGRPYFFLVPEKAWRKLYMCLLADLPEMLFDAVLCAVMIKLVAWKDFTWLPMLMTVIMMTVFDLMAQTVGIICVKLLRQFGKFSMMFVRYVVMFFILLFGMIPSEALTGGLTAGVADDLSMVITVLIGILALTYFVLWLIVIAVSWRIFSRA